MLLALTRELHRIIARRVQEEWPRNAYQPVELLGRKAVIIGAGGIGTNIAARPRRSGCMSPRWILEKSRHLRWWTGGFPDRLDEVLPDADVVFVAAPDTAASQNMLGQKQFNLMKKGSYFIAVSRGRLYLMDALVEALKSGRTGRGRGRCDQSRATARGHRCGS